MSVIKNHSNEQPLFNSQTVKIMANNMHIEFIVSKENSEYDSDEEALKDLVNGNIKNDKKDVILRLDSLSSEMLQSVENGDKSNKDTKPNR